MSKQILFTKSATNFNRQVPKINLVEKYNGFESVCLSRNAKKVNDQMDQMCNDLIKGIFTKQTLLFRINTPRRDYRTKDYMLVQTPKRQELIQKRNSIQRQRQTNREKFIQSCVRRTLQNLIPSNSNIAQHVSQNNLLNTVNMQNLSSMNESANRMTTMSMTRRDIPRHLRFSRNSKKLALQSSSLKAIQTQGDTKPSDRDEFLRNYNHELLYFENKVERVISRRKKKGDRYFQRQRRLQLKTSQARLRQKIQSKRHVITQGEQGRYIVKQHQESSRLFNEQKLQRKRRNKLIRMKRYFDKKWNRIGYKSKGYEKGTISQNQKRWQTPQIKARAYK